MMKIGRIFGALLVLAVHCTWPHIAFAQFTDQRNWGGVSTGSANSQSITVPNYAADLPGVVLRFLPGFTNSAISTGFNLTINGRSYIVKKRTNVGIENLDGGDVSPNQIAQVVWDGTRYELLNPLTGQRVCDPRDAGALGDSVHDDTAAFNACITYLTGFGGGELRVSPANGQYCLFTGITVPANVSISIIGASRSVALSACGHDVTVVTMQGNSSQLVNLSIVGNGGNPGDPFSFSKPTILMSNGTQMLLANLSVSGGTNAIRITAVNGAVGDWVLYNVEAQNVYGSAVIFVAGANGQPTGGWFERVKTDQTFPNGSPSSAGSLTPPAAWQANHSYSSASGFWPIVLLPSGYYVQLMQNGTTGGSAPAAPLYGATACDPACAPGNAEWRMVGNQTFYGVQLDSYVIQVFFWQCDNVGPYSANLLLSNQGNGDVPRLINITQSNFGSALQVGILLQSGQEFQMSDSVVSTCFELTCVLFETGTDGIHVPWADIVALVNNIFFGGNVGISHNEGTNLAAQNNRIYGTNIAFQTAPSMTDFNFSNNLCGNSTAGNNGQCYNVGGGSSYYIVANNDLHGNVSSSVPANGGGPATSYVAGNIGP